MKLSQFHQGHTIETTLADGLKLKVRYNPRFLTQESFGFYDKFVRTEPEEDENYFNVAYSYLASILQWIDIQDDNNKDIEPTADNLRDIIKLDYLAVKAIHQDIIADMNERANPTLPEEEESSSGSTQTASSTETI